MLDATVPVASCANMAQNGVQIAHSTRSTLVIRTTGQGHRLNVAVHGTTSLSAANAQTELLGRRGPGGAVGGGFRLCDGTLCALLCVKSDGGVLTRIGCILERLEMSRVVPAIY